MTDNHNKPKEYIEQKYIELLERSNKDLHNKGKFFSAKSLILVSVVSVFFLSFYGLYFKLKSNNDYFDKHLTTTSYNHSDLLIENDQGVFFKIDEYTNTKWLTGDNVLINIDNNQLEFIATNNNPRDFSNKYTLHIPKDRIYSLKLSDGTHIKINENSKLAFTNLRDNKNPSVYIDGEAFFKVAHSDVKKFKVKVGETLVEVHGTSFNVSNYYKNQFSQIALVEGSVKLYSKTQALFMNQGELATVYKDKNSIDIDNASIDDVIFWSQDQMYFTNEALPDLLQKIEKWYHVNFTIEYTPITQLHFSGNINKNDGLEAFLKMLAYTENISYKIEDKNIKLNKSIN